MMKLLRMEMECVSWAMFQPGARDRKKKKKKHSLSSVKLGGFSAARCFSRCHKKLSLFTVKKQLSATGASMASQESRKCDFVLIICKRDLSSHQRQRLPSLGVTAEPGLLSGKPCKQRRRFSVCNRRKQSQVDWKLPLDVLAAAHGGNPRSSPRSRVFRPSGSDGAKKYPDEYSQLAQRPRETWDWCFWSARESRERRGRRRRRKGGKMPFIRSEKVVTARVTLPPPSLTPPLLHPSVCHGASSYRSIHTTVPLFPLENTKTE